MKSPKRKNPNNPIRLTFTAHLDELRSRFFAYLVFLCLGIVVGYFLHLELIDLLTRPLRQPLFYSSVTGGFDFVFQVSLGFGFLVSLPMLLYQLYGFVKPALPVALLPRKILLYLLASALLLGTGISFAYFISLPSTLFFLSSFAAGNIKTLISTAEYFSFITSYMIGFGIAFQLPLILLVMDAIHPLDLKVLLGEQRLVIVLCFVVAAILTPTPDIVNQCIFAIPLILLYELSLLVIWFQHRSASHKK